MDSNRENLRISLKNSLISNLLFNERRQKDSIKLFEISDIYKKDPAFIQEKLLGIIISGRLGDNYNDFSKKLDHNYLNTLLNGELDSEPFQIIEISRDTIDTKKKDKIFYVEIKLDDIPEAFFSNLGNEVENLINFINYKPISEFPCSTRDLSFSISDLSNVNKVLKALDKISDEMIKKSFIFDFYKNKKTETIKVGYRFIFQSTSKTLSEKEINKKLNEIIKPIIMLDGVSIPGM